MKKKIDFVMISKVIKIVSFLIIAVCFLCMSLSAITMVSGETTKTYGPAYSFIFEGTIKTNNISYKANGMSFSVLAAFIMLVLSIVAISVSFMNKGKEKYIPQWLVLISAMLALVASIVLLSSHRSLANVLADTLIDGHSEAVTTTIYNNSKIEFGIWGPAVFGFFSTFLSLVSLLFDGTFDKVRTKIGII